jgi:E3 ubiquitin-protein ligase HOS1
MDRRFDGAFVPPESTNGFSFARPSTPQLQPNYCCKKVQAALEHLASIDLIELCSEAKTEHCRATRDLRSCGRYIQSVLSSCRHASLCDECSQRCDICPICRIPIPKNGVRFRLRLYSECIEAGLISKRCDDRFQEKEDGDNNYHQKPADVQRLYSLFDVAMENNLVSLICHYITDVCMDESAVSSDPSVAILLDEIVVKDWCKRTFQNILNDLQAIYNLTAQAMKNNLSSLFKFSSRLNGLSNVLEVLESSLKSTLSPHLEDLHHLQENVLKTKQHMEMIMWCIRHEFLENVPSRHSNLTSWQSAVLERKSAAMKRSWPDIVSNSWDSGTVLEGSTLFIEHALSNLDIEQGNYENGEEDSGISSLQKESGLNFFRSKIKGMSGCYPFQTMRNAVDILFLRGSSDLVVAKQAIFLYYLYDRHWTTPDEHWRHVIDDFAATFNITRHSLLESFTFYLLDDHTDEALEEACNFLPEISGPTTHPRVAQVLLERQNPDAALMVLRWSGRDGGTHLVSLGEAITAVRVRIECGLLTEAFMYQRNMCTKVKDKKSKRRSYGDDGDEVGPTTWTESLVTEICCLCIRRNLVDRMIELPWDSDEEKYLHKCLFDFATESPSTSVGSLLVVFYLQRYRYAEAYQADCKLQTVEQNFISNNSLTKDVLVKMGSVSHWRSCLVEKSIELLPEIQQQQLKSGKFSECIPAHGEEVDTNINNSSFTSQKSQFPSLQEPNLAGLLLPKPSNPQSQLILNPSLEFSSSSILINNRDIGQNKPLNSITKTFKFDDITTPISSRRAGPLGEFNKSSSKRVPREKEDDIFIDKILNDSTPYSLRVSASPQKKLSVSSQAVLKEPYPSRADKHRNVAPPSVDLMDIAWSREEEEVSMEDKNVSSGLRWRSDDVSDDNEEPLQQQRNRSRGTRRSRLVR